jgi:hypothetical protein
VPSHVIANSYNSLIIGLTKKGSELNKRATQRVGKGKERSLLSGVSFFCSRELHFRLAMGKSPDPFSSFFLSLLTRTFNSSTNGFDPDKNNIINLSVLESG